MHDRCKHTKFQWWLKSSGLYWRLISTKRELLGASRGAVCSAELVLEAGEPLPRLSPAVSPGGTGQCPLGLPGARGELMCQKPNPQPGGTLTSWRTRAPDTVCCVTRGSTTEACTWSPATPGVGVDRVSSSPAQTGITLGGCWAQALCARCE